MPPRKKSGRKTSRHATGHLRHAAALAHFLHHVRHLAVHFQKLVDFADFDARAGRDARTLKPLLAPHPSIESAHPSPLSAHNGFFGSRPFSRANALLTERGAEPIDWRLP